VPAIETEGRLIKIVVELMVLNAALVSSGQPSLEK
jgi:hypothetical protein